MPFCLRLLFQCSFEAVKQLIEKMDGEIKKMRVRSGPIKKWTKTDAYILLTILKEVGKDGFEKPTAQVFYNEVINQNPILQEYTWKSMRDKIRNLKMKYKAALDWRASTGAGLDEEEDASTIHERMMDLCPEFDFLDAIFDGSKSMINPFRMDTEDEINFENELAEVVLNLPFSNQNHSQNENDVRDVPKPKRKLEEASSTSTRKGNEDVSAVKYLAEVHLDLLNYYKRKLEINSKLETKKVELLERSIEIEQMRLEIEKERNNGELMMREKELDMKMALERERMNQEFELKKLELEMQYKKTNIEFENDSPGC